MALILVVVMVAAVIGLLTAVLILVFAWRRPPSPDGPEADYDDGPPVQ
jgi:hypothetical protein